VYCVRMLFVIIYERAMHRYY